MKSALCILFLVYSMQSIAGEVSLSFNEANFNILGRDDVQIDKAYINISCYRRSTVWEMLNNGLDEHSACDNFKINGVDNGFQTGDKFIHTATSNLELEKINNQSFLGSDLDIQFSNRREAHLCLSVYVRLSSENPINFQNSSDRFSVLSYCTGGELPNFSQNLVTTHKRVGSVNEFTEKLSQGIDLILNP